MELYVRSFWFTPYIRMRSSGEMCDGTVVRSFWFIPFTRMRSCGQVCNGIVI